jgi:hypothetical protein
MSVSIDKVSEDSIIHHSLLLALSVASRGSLLFLEYPSSISTPLCANILADKKWRVDILPGLLVGLLIAAQVQKA